jgi:phosphate transport system substrate-binding protein
VPINPRGDRWPWYGVAVVAAILLIAALAIVTGVEDGQQPPFLDPTFDPEPEAAPFDDGRLHLAGSGSNLPLTRALARAFAEQGHARPVVHPSIGSGGGVRALLDGATAIALVSRPLKPAERERGLVATPYARLPVVIGAHEDVPESSITPEQLVDIFDSERTEWSNGAQIFVLQREQGDSSHAVVDAAIAGFKDANEKAYQESRFRVLYHDSSMAEALANTQGSIGLHSGAVDPQLPFKTLALDGVAPTLDAVASGRYPLYKDLAFVTVGPPSGEAKAFIEFVVSRADDAIFLEHGAIRLGREGS